MGRIGKAGIMRTRGARIGERLGIAVGLAIVAANFGCGSQYVNCE